MKTAIFKIEGTPSGRELVVLSYTTPRGGMSNASIVPRGQYAVIARDANDDPIIENGAVKSEIVPAQTVEQIAVSLASAINTSIEYCKEQFSAQGLADMVVVTCADSVSDVTFIAQVQGNDALTITQVS